MHLQIESDDHEAVERAVLTQLRHKKGVRLASQVSDRRWNVTLHTVADEPDADRSGPATS